MFEPSDYQKRIFEWFQKPDGPIAVNAVAGSGKTTTLVKGFQQLRNAGSQLFAAFNTSIVAELKKRLPSTVNCQTIHSLGYATLRKAFPDAKWDLENGNVKYRKMARDIEVDRNQFSDPKAIQDCVLSFLNYAQLTLTPLEVEPLMAMADRFGIDIPSGVTVEKVASTVKSMLEIGLEQGRKGLISFSDMLWMPATLELNPPKYSLVAIDEAQDMNRAQMSLVMRAMDTGGNFVSVGDPCQPTGTQVLKVIHRTQSSYKTEWVNIEKIQVGDYLAAPNVSDGHVYGSGLVKGVTHRPFEGNLVVATMDDGAESAYTPNHYCMASFAPFKGKHYVYLQRRNRQFRIGVSRNTEGRHNNRFHQEKAEAMWILGFYGSRNEALMMEAAISGKFGISGLTWSGLNRQNDLFETAWSFIGDNYEQGISCLAFFGKDVRYPLIDREKKEHGKQQSLKRPIVVHASNLITGCLMLRLPEGKRKFGATEWKPVVVSSKPYNGTVISFDVDKYHSYIADGIGTRNCQAIYMFAGAESDSFDQIKNYFGAKELPLTFCYRCPESVILEAQKIVPQIECPPGTKAGIVDTITEEQFDKMLTPGDMVVCRLTAPLVKLCFELIKRRIPAKVKGRDIGATIANAVKQIMKRETDMSKFPNLMYRWQENQLGMLREKLGSEDQQESVNDRVAVLEICYAMFSPNSPNGFVEDIKSLFNDDQSPITLCTVHRAKGLENDRVFIIRPDKLPLVRKNQTQAQINQEMNLKYVAITRAKNELYFVTPDPSTTEDNNRYRNPGIPGITL